MYESDETLRIDENIQTKRERERRVLMRALSSHRQYFVEDLSAYPGQPNNHYIWNERQLLKEAKQEWVGFCWKHFVLVDSGKFLDRWMKCIEKQGDYVE
jgi:hypothetical protein